MSTSTTCQTHDRPNCLLVINSEKYICEDCAIFNPLYKFVKMIYQEEVLAFESQINQKCQFLIDCLSAPRIAAFNAMKEIESSLEDTKQKLINQIESQIAQVTACVTNQFLIDTKTDFDAEIEIVKSILHQAKPETKLKLFVQNSQLTESYKKSVKQAEQKNQNTFNQYTQALFKLDINDIDLSKQVSQALGRPSGIQNRMDRASGDDLLDFSEFNTTQPKQLTFAVEDKHFNEAPELCCEDQEVPSLKFKRTIERMNTAECMQDSVVSGQTSFCDIHSYQQSERSICSTASSQVVRVAAKKSEISIAFKVDIEKQLSYVAPSIKKVTLANLGLNNVETTKILKGLSTSYIQTLNLSQNRLTDKILHDLRQYRNKGLKKIELGGNNIRVSEKRTKELIKKLETEGLKVQV